MYFHSSLKICTLEYIRYYVDVYFFLKNSLKDVSHEVKGTSVERSSFKDVSAGLSSMFYSDTILWLAIYLYNRKNWHFYEKLVCCRNTSGSFAMVSVAVVGLQLSIFGKMLL